MDVDNLKWKTVNFDELGASAFNANLEGLIGIEECIDYGIVSKRKARREALKEKANKRKSLENVQVSNKKARNNSFGDFEVENIKSNISITPSKAIKKEKNRVRVKKDKNAEAIQKENNKKVIKKERKEEAIKKETEIKINGQNPEDNTESNVKDVAIVGKQKNKRKKERKRNIDNNNKANGVGDGETKENEEIEETDSKEDVGVESVSLEEMQAWSGFGIPEVILKGLAYQGFQTPTTIQELTLPAAMLGRRDILGAAETGSGKTLAFGIPILNGILNLKEKAELGINEAARKTNIKPKTNPIANERAKIINFNKLTKEERKAVMGKIREEKKMKKRKIRKRVDDDNESDDDSGDDDDDDSSDDSQEEEEDSEEDIEMEEQEGDDVESEQEMDEVELEGSEDSLESGDDSELDDNISGSDDSKNEDIAEERNSDVEQESSRRGSDEDGEDDKQSEDSDFEEREEEVVGVNEKGIGCVKVIDNISPLDLPGAPPPRRELKPLYALILTPTRELAIQVKNHLVAAAKFTDISVAVVVGGMAQVKQERLLLRGPEVVVATPGRLWQMVQQGNDHLSQFTDIRYLAIDETDRMIERGHFEELHLLLERLNDDEVKRSGRQNFVFSATLTMVHDLPHHLKGRKVTKKGKVINRKAEKLTPDQKLKKVIEMLGITDPKIVDVTIQNQGASNTLTECMIACPIDHKDYYLYYLIKRHPGRTIVFCNSIGCVKRLAQLFGLLQCKPLPLHANMQQRQRLKNLDRFRADPHGLLVATDVAARGLDIPDVEHVFHYQVPRTAENYVHRSGRTARASKEGITILIMEPGEAQNYSRMCRTLSKKEELPHFPVDGALLAGVRERVDAARELDVASLRGRKERAQQGWLQKAADEMDILLDDRNMCREMDAENIADTKNFLSIKMKQLNSLLAGPLFPKGFSYKFPSNNAIMNKTLGMNSNKNAVETMKSALETGLVRKFKNSTKNQAMFQMAKAVKKDSNVASSKQNAASSENNVAHENKEESGEKVSKNKWKKLKRNKSD